MSSRLKRLRGPGARARPAAKSGFRPPGTVDSGGSRKAIGARRSLPQSRHSDQRHSARRDRCEPGGDPPSHGYQDSRKDRSSQTMPRRHRRRAERFRIVAGKFGNMNFGGDDGGNRGGSAAAGSRPAAAAGHAAQTDGREAAGTGTADCPSDGSGRVILAILLTTDGPCDTLAGPRRTGDC